MAKKQKKAARRNPAKKKKIAVQKTAPKKKSAKKASRKNIQLEGGHKTRMRVIGIGGGGGNIVSEIAHHVPKIDFIAANTDTQALKGISKKVVRFPFGHALTGGLGSGMDASLGERAAREDKKRLTRILENQDVSILIASLGGGTGSGASPVFAEVSRGLKNLTLGIFTMPFEFEGEKRKKLAEQALEKLKPLVSAYIVIPNERIFELIDRTTPLDRALSTVNKYLGEALGGLIETIYSPGLINIDFADLRSILEGRGKLAYLHSVQTSGQNKAEEAVRQILKNPLSEYGIDGVDRILFNIVADRRLKMQEVAQISNSIAQHNPKAKIIFGVSCRRSNTDKLRITLFAVGCKEEKPALFQLKKKKRKTAKKKAEPEPEPVMEEKEEKPALFQLKKKKRKTAKKKAEPEPEPVMEEKKEKPKKKVVKKRKKKAVPKQKQQKLPVPAKEPERVRRNALDLKRVADQELEEMEEHERRWDVPAFLRKRHGNN